MSLDVHDALLVKKQHRVMVLPSLRCCTVQYQALWVQLGNVTDFITCLSSRMSVKPFFKVEELLVLL